jgi:cephalosporin hydroxylase
VRFADLEPSPVPIYQSPGEFGMLWDFAAQLEPKVVVEIGSLYGGTLWYWLQIPTVEEVVSVDLLTDWDEIRDEVTSARQHWPAWSDKLRTLEADSHDPATAETIAGPIDVLFVDGDHVYEGVRTDFDLWSPLVRSGGVVAFHDTVPNDGHHEPGVVRFCSELKAKHPSIEYLTPDGAGITAFVL